ncbi:MAG TPA: hypothetical protein VG326_00690 [Tepidisphaeraceae bacterium]|nr:hypothetical protein [Tepidisphaeraceae bacterium]
MTTQWLERSALVTVKTYPTPSEKYHETVCTAAVTKEEGWLRLYPIQFRDLPRHQQYAKYQVIKLRMTKHEGDARPESFRPDEKTIEVLETLGTVNDKQWQRRREWIDPTQSASMCEIQREQKRTGKSLGVFRPKEVTDLVFEEDDPEWSGKKQGILNQMRLFYEKQLDLEKIPYSFKYKYICEDANCKGHTQSIIDWEIMELYRNVKRSSQDENEVKQKLRQKFLDQLCGPGRSTSFFVGSHSRYPATFMILGVFWPPKPVASLFESLPC